MNPSAYISKINIYFIRFIQLQLFMSLISLPFLIAWGLPLSLLSPVGNLVFSPFLSLFLLLSSLLFFTELLHIPNALIAWCLDTLTTIWLWLLDLHSHSWLIGFAKPSTWFLLIIPCATITIVMYAHTQTSRYISTSLFLLLLGLYIALQMHAQYTPTLHQLTCNNGTVTIMHDNKQIAIIDPGVIGRTASACSWAQYTLVPHIIQTTGSLTIDHVIILQPNARTFEALTILCTQMKIKHVYLPWWKGSLQKSAWRKFFIFRDTLQKNNGTIIHLGTHPMHIVLSAESMLHIQPTQQRIAYQDATFPTFHVCGNVDKESFEFYSAKHKIESK